MRMKIVIYRLTMILLNIIPFSFNFCLNCGFVGAQEYLKINVMLLYFPLAVTRMSHMSEYVLDLC